MSRRRDVDSHRNMLDEIREIMNSMRTLAYIETRKLTRFLDAQRSVVGTLERVGADFLGFYPYPDSQPGATAHLRLVVGTERGFCGDFNESLLEQLDSELRESGGEAPSVIVVGGRLHSRLEADPRVAVFIEGANVAEEVEIVLSEIVSALARLQPSDAPLTLTVLYREAGTERVLSERLLPPFQTLHGTPPAFRHPPDLTLEPATFLSELTDQYLFASLNQVLYTSLLAENQIRLQHLDGAVSHLEETLAELARQSNRLRQEEITEEIEVIMLSAPVPPHYRQSDDDA
jgi:F-type H+-transporting ATPase subunit gamma